jgi:enoyl-CoA hydratase/carnithine racemase
MSILCEGLTLEEVEPGIFDLVLDRPRQRNALTEQMMTALSTAVDTVNRYPGAVALIVSGHGDAFCSGADLSVVRDRRKGDAAYRWPEVMGREAELLADCEVVTIAAITGPAVGLGMGLALACDITVMEEQAFLAEAHLALGLCPTAMCWWVPRMAGLARASDIVLTGRRVGGPEAAAIGLVSRLVGAGEARAAALDIARDLAERPADMLRFAKLAMRMAQDEPRMHAVRRFGGAANRMHRMAEPPPEGAR